MSRPERDELAPATAASGDGGLISVASFQDPLRAQMARSLLLSAGIDCFLQGEHVNQMLAAAFRARLRVRSEEAEDAREILGEVDAECLLEVRDDA